MQNIRLESITYPLLGGVPGWVAITSANGQPTPPGAPLPGGDLIEYLNKTLFL